MVYVLTFARLLVAGLFAVSAASKLTSSGRRSFRRGVSSLARIAPAWAGLVAALVIGAECLVVLLVTGDRTPSAGLALAAVLLAGFTVVLARAVRTASTESCHCFGSSGPAVARRHVVRTATLGLLAAAGAALGWAGQLGTPAPAGVGLVAVAALVAGVLLVRMDDVVAVFTPMTPGPHQQRQPYSGGQPHSGGRARAVPPNVQPPPTFAPHRFS